MTKFKEIAVGGAKVSVGLLGMGWSVVTGVSHVLGGVASRRVTLVMGGFAHSVHQVKHAAEIFADGIDDLSR